MNSEPQKARGKGWLKNGNTPGDPNTAPRCGARTKRGTICKAPGMKTNGRCRVHGGRSTGPRTAEGKERVRLARTKHGYYSAESKAERQAERKQLRELRQACEVFRGMF